MLETHNIEILCSQTFAIILKCLNRMQNVRIATCVVREYSIKYLSYSLKVCSHLCADNMTLIIENLQLNLILLKI